VRAPGPEAVAYCVQGSWRTAVLAALAGYRRRAGFDTSDGRWLYTQRVTYHSDHHHSARILALAGNASDDDRPIQPRLYPGEVERVAVDALLGDWPQGASLIALAPGSIWGTKRWPHFPQLAAQLAAWGRLVVVGSRDDTP